MHLAVVICFWGAISLLVGTLTFDAMAKPRPAEVILETPQVYQNSIFDFSIDTNIPKKCIASISTSMVLDGSPLNLKTQVSSTPTSIMVKVETPLAIPPGSYRITPKGSITCPLLPGVPRVTRLAIPIFFIQVLEGNSSSTYNRLKK